MLQGKRCPMHIYAALRHLTLLPRRAHASAYYGKEREAQLQLDAMTFAASEDEEEQRYEHNERKRATKAAVDAWMQDSAAQEVRMLHANAARNAIMHSSAKAWS